ncbi:MAG: (d)CMP kinase [Longimicrobiales bacterium]|nr:(d)CMP kinase [Longimicrobiales bacterium]
MITLDGPAGSGKSTTAREVARRLGFRHLDSGALYRALTVALLESGLPEPSWETLPESDLRALGVRVTASGSALEVRLGERLLGPELRTVEVTALVSPLSRLPAVRGALLELQHQAGARGRLVADGRDMGTVVFPDAEVKVFLVADLGERARRRLLEQVGSPPSDQEVAEEVLRIAARDARDAGREISPLRRPDDAVDLDTTRLTFEEQVSAVVELARARTGVGSRRG